MKKYLKILLCLCLALCVIGAFAACADDTVDEPEGSDNGVVDTTDDGADDDLGENTDEGGNDSENNNGGDNGNGGNGGNGNGGNADGGNTETDNSWANGGDNDDPDFGNEPAYPV